MKKKVTNNVEMLESQIAKEFKVAKYETSNEDEDSFEMKMDKA